MATKNHTHAPAGAISQAGYIHPLTPPEISITLEPRGQAIYHGTWEQLQQEGAVGPLDKPENRTWVEGIYWRWLSRCRPDGAKKSDSPGPVDYWCLHVRLASEQGSGFEAARQHALREQIRQAQFELSPAGKLSESRYWQARRDAAFQAFLLASGAKSAPKPRKPRATRGASA